jgi:hypothetical protein
MNNIPDSNQANLFEFKLLAVPYLPIFIVIKQSRISCRLLVDRTLFYSSICVASRGFLTGYIMEA